MDHIQYLDAQITDRLRRVAELERELVERRAELRAYEDIKARLAGSGEAPRRSSRAAPATEPDTAAGPGKRRVGKLTKVLVTAAVRAYPAAVSIDDGVGIAAEQLGEDVPRNNVRASLWSNSTAGFLERLGDGLFRATQAGAALIGERLGVADNQTNGANAAHQTEGDGGDDAKNGDQAEADDLLSRTGTGISD